MTFTFCHLMHQNSKSLSDCFFKDPFHCPELFSQGEFNHAGLIYTPMKHSEILNFLTNYQDSVHFVINCLF